MRYLILFIGNTLGGLFAAYSYKNRESFALRLLSFLFPFTFNTAFWVYQYQKGRLLSSFGFLNQSLDTAVKGFAAAFVISFLFALFCKALGFIIAKYIDLKK